MSKYRVLVVDDEEISADGISEILKQAYGDQFELVTLYSGTKALNYLQENHVDILITDINMPKISGIQLIKEIQAIDSSIRIVILTGFGSLEYAQEAMRYGVRHFLQKPVFPDQIMESIQEVLSKLAERDSRELLELRHISEQVLLGAAPNARELSVAILMMKADLQLHNGETLRRFFQEEGIEHLTGEINQVTNYYFNPQPKLDQKMSALPGMFSAQATGTMVYSGVVKLSELSQVYQKGVAFLERGFYYPGEVLVQVADFPAISLEGQRNSKRSLDGLEAALQGKHYQVGLTQLTSFFKGARENLLPVSDLKSWILDIFSRVFVENGKSYLEIADFEKRLQQTATLQDLQELVAEQLQLIEKADTIILPEEKISVNLDRIVERYYSDPELSLKWISQNLLFLNAEHLGRTYLKETGKKFSNHLQQIRMGKAKEFLEAGHKVYEVAEMTGYRENPDYFTKLFKKIYGETPNQVLKRSE